MNKRNDIQILRALAVIFVVLFHLEITGIESGFLGVDVFFVVSGFLMAILYKPGEMKNFLTRRARRLLPAYFATIFLTLLASIFIVLPSELGQVATQSIYSLFFANNIGFWMQNSYFSKSDFNPLLHLWSLGVEIQFYLIVPILVWFFRKSRIFLPLILMGSFLSCLFIVGISPKTSFFMMPLRVWEFLIGFVVAYYFTNNGNIKTSKYEWLGLMGLIGLCVIPFLNIDGQSLNRLEAHPSFYALFVCILTSLVLIFGLPKSLKDGFLGGFFAKIGDYSYSIYLAHFPIIVLYLYKPFSGTILQPDNYLDKIILLVLITIFSIFIHKYVEIRRISSVGKVYGISLASIFVLMCITKFTPTIMYSQNEQNIFNSLEDRSTYRCGKMIRITDPSAISCKVNPESFDSSVLLVGDSHADSIKQAFVEISSENKKNTYFIVSNTPLIDNLVTPEKLFLEAKKLKTHHIVLHYSPGALKVETLQKVLQLAQQNSVKIDLILPVPVYKDSIPKLLFLEQSEKINAKSYLAGHAEYFNQLKALENQYGIFNTYDVYQVLCKPDCVIETVDHEPYYFDNNHLTLTGAQELKPIFEKVF